MSPHRSAEDFKLSTLAFCEWLNLKKFQFLISSFIHHRVELTWSNIHHSQYSSSSSSTIYSLIHTHSWNFFINIFFRLLFFLWRNYKTGETFTSYNRKVFIALNRSSGKRSFHRFTFYSIILNYITLLKRAKNKASDKKLTTYRERLYRL